MLLINFSINNNFDSFWSFIARDNIPCVANNVHIVFDNMSHNISTSLHLTWCNHYCSSCQVISQEMGITIESEFLLISMQLLINDQVSIVALEQNTVGVVMTVIMDCVVQCVVPPLL